MDWLRKLRNRGGDNVREPAATEVPACEHVALVAKWERAEDIGKDSLASGYRCEGCGAEFTPAEAQRLRETEAARVKQRIAE